MGKPVLLIVVGLRGGLDHWFGIPDSLFTGDYSGAMWKVGVVRVLNYFLTRCFCCSLAGSFSRLSSFPSWGDLAMDNSLEALSDKSFSLSSYRIWCCEISSLDEIIGLKRGYIWN